MVQIFTPAKFTDLNIDTIERALVFSALALQGAAFIFTEGRDDPEGVKDKIKFRLPTKGRDKVDLRITAKLPFDPAEYAQKGGFAVSSVLDFIKAYYELSGAYKADETKFNFPTLASSPSDPALPTPNYSLLDSFEKYFVYHALLLQASLTENRNQVITIDYSTSSFGLSEIKINLILPLDIEIYGKGGNYLQAVNRVATAIAVSTIDSGLFLTTVSSLSDDLLLDDSILFSD